MSVKSTDNILSVLSGVSDSYVLGAQGQAGLTSRLAMIISLHVHQQHSAEKHFTLGCMYICN